MKQNGSTQRIGYLDMVRGFATFLVIWGHAIQYGGSEADFFENKLFIYIYSFHMPVFLLISGFLFSKSIHRRNFADNLKNKTLRIAVPAVVWGCIYCLVKWGVETVLGNPSAGFSLSLCVEEIGNIWFLWTIFMCMVAVMIADKIGKDRFFLPMLVLCMIAFYFLPFRDYTLFLFPFFVAGYYAQKNAFCKFKSLAYLALLLYPLLLQYYGTKHYIYVSGIDIFSSDYGIWQQAGIDLFRWLVGFAGCMVVIITAKLFPEKYPDSLLERLLSAVGKYSLEIYVMGRILEDYLGSKFMWKLVDRFHFLANDLIYTYVYTLVCAIIFVVILYYIADLLSKAKMMIMKSAGKGR